MPSTILSDNGVSSGSAGLKTTAASDGALALQTTTAGGTATTAVYVDTSQNVGIGTTSPSNRLSVVSASGSDGFISISSPTTDTAGFSVNGGTDSNKGAIVRFQKGASTKWTMGTDSAIIGGTSDNFHLYSGGANAILFSTNASERMRLDASGNLGIGTTTTTQKLNVYGSDGNNNVASFTRASGATMYAYADTGANVGFFTGSNGAGSGFYANATNNTVQFNTNGSERARIDSSGRFLVGKTTDAFATAGVTVYQTGEVNMTRTDTPLYINRLSTDGVLVGFYQDTVQEGSISVSGTTVSYNGGHLARYAQTVAAKDESLKKGTVLSNLDEMNVYIVPTTYWTEEDELPEGVSVGDVKVEEHQVANEQLNKVKVSDVEGDANVAGVFVNWSHDEQHNVDEINMAMTGDMIIRIAQGTAVQRGDLLMSAGDGTAKPQGDDIVRAKTVAKVTSTHVTCTYEDGSYCVPCVLMAC